MKNRREIVQGHFLLLKDRTFWIERDCQVSNILKENRSTLKYIIVKFQNMQQNTNPKHLWRGKNRSHNLELRLFGLSSVTLNADKEQFP